MKRFKYLALATLVAFGACDEGEDLIVDDDPITGSVTATVTAENAGVEGVTVNLVGPTSASLTTPASGTVTFNNVEEGAYAVTISGIPSGYVFSNTSQTVTITSDGQQATASFSGSIVRSASISGQVTANGNAVEGATIEISGPDGTETTQTGTAGSYQFTGLIAGEYDVTLQEASLAGIECEETTVERNVEPGESEIANFSCGGQATPASVAIERITDQAGNAVDRSDVEGIIVVQVGVDEGGQEVEKLNVYANGVLVCEQTLGSSAVSGPMAVEEEFEIDCVVNTAAVRDLAGEPTTQFVDAGDGLPFEPIFLNGDIDIVAEAITQSDEDDNPTATASITLVNPDVLALNVENDNPEAPDFIIDSDDGLRWLSGSLTFTVYPIIYSAPFDANDPAIARANFSFDSYVSNETTGSFTNGTDSRPLVGADAIPATWQLSDITPDATNGSFTFTLPDTHTGGAINGDGVLEIGNSGGVDDLITGDIGAQNISISTVTSFGQFGPGVVCSNISNTCTPTAGTVSANPLRVFYQGVLQSGTGAVNNVLRVDNQEPWANTISLDAHPLATSFSGAVTAQGITNNGISAVRGGMNVDALRDGWVNREYTFDSGMWASTGATDAPNRYATHPYFTLPTGITASTTALAGIGVDASSLAYFADESETGSINALTLAGITPGTDAQRLRNVTSNAACGEGETWPCSVETGADLPGDEGPGLDLLDYPNSNEWDDVSLAAVVADLFENVGVTNILEVGVDGHDPIFRNFAGATGTSPLYPAAAGTKYNTYGDEQASNPSNLEETLTCVGTVPNQTCTYPKTAGIFSGSITDAGNGFSGAAGVAMSDWENGCAAGETACTGSFMNERAGVTLQVGAFGGGSILQWEWSNLADVGTSTFLDATGAAIGAYDATVATPATHDGYRQQQPTAWDRAANSSMADETAEQIADKTRPLVGNVEMPTVTMFALGTSYTYGGESEDIVDLRYTDFAIDFNSITTIQPYSDEADGTGFEPNDDAEGNDYLATPGVMANTGNSLQLPMAEMDHTAFGSASILLHEDLSATVEFVGCVALFDEGGEPIANPNDVHVPRGPRWRTWDHAYPYGLINTQYNTFTPSSVPVGDCPTADAIRDGVDPSANTAAWNFGIGVETGGSQLELSVSGQSGVFVPDIDVTMIDLYYIDEEGRARILDLSGANWTGPFVEDIGSGAFGRTYIWTYGGTLPPAAETMTPTGHDDAYFFTVRFGDGSMLLWDDTAN